MLKLAHGLQFADLYRRDGLVRLDALFLESLAAADARLHARLLAARAAPEALPLKEESELILEVAPYLDDFLAALFGIAPEFAALSERHHELAPLYSVKRQFVQRRAANKIKPDQAAQLDGAALETRLGALIGRPFDELAFARKVTEWLADETGNADALDTAMKYAAWALHTDEGRERARAGVLFKAPAKTDPLHLLKHAQTAQHEGVTAYTIKPEHIRRRRGFELTDAGTDLVGALDQSNYCIWCHTQGKDSCSKGLKEKSPADDPARVTFKKSAFGVTLAGCPLEEK